ncbi:MAG: DUF1553 domain-containing protein [Bryobacteraceae bacterium]
MTKRLTVVLAFAVCAQAQTLAPSEFFEKQVRPILVSRCFACHSAASQPVMGQLRLDSREGILKGGSRGPAVVPGATESLLIKSIRQEGALKMPPGAKLRDAEIAVLAEWVKMGAPWGVAAPATTAVPAAKFWSLSALRDPAVRAGSEIDGLILAALEAKGLKPAPPADKRTLIRRATYDLTGLPPTPDEIHRFLKDDSPGAFATVIDRLLASPHYGERWGRHWLDVARYSDSNGLDENLVFVNAWRYRDYVIRSFNQDKPYDQFIREQLAGDLLPQSGDPAAKYDRLTATGFLSLGAKMLAEDDPVKMEMDIVDEQVDTTSRAFMGLTTGCARCHDHKFDPIPTADYYSLAGIFRSTKTMENFKVVARWQEHVLAPEADREKVRAHEKRMEDKRKEIEAITKPANKDLQTEARGKVAAYLMGGAELMRSEDVKLEHSPGPDSIELNHTFVHEKEFAFDVPHQGLYQLEFHYASAEARSVSVYINGELMKSQALAAATGTATPDTWSVEGVFAFASGRNTIRLERPSNFFPQTDKFLLKPYSGADPPQTAHQLARKLQLNPEFLSQWSGFLRRTKEDPNSVMREWHASATAEYPKVASTYEKAFQETDRAEKPDERQKLLKEVLYDKFGPFAGPPNATPYYPAAIGAQVKKLEADLKQLEKDKPVYPLAMGVSEGTIANCRIHLRGSHLTLGEEVPRQFLRAITTGTQAVVPPEHSGRLEFANWLADPNHPLTSRVMVNRIWRWHFGTGIVASVDNFGRLGEMPSNQDLLDWLARRFIATGWSIKQMHRTIMLSNAYQRSAQSDEKALEADTEDRLLWRMNRRRLEAEEIRDSLYAVSDQLDETMGGTMLKFKEREYVTSTANRDTTDYDSPRRAVYMPVVRSSLYDVFQAFDFGDPSVINGDRPTTVVAPQALFLMNGSPVLKTSRKLAELLIAQTVDPGERIAVAFERAFGRLPTADDRARSMAFLAKAAQTYAPHEADPKAREVKVWQSFCKALMSANEFIYVD